MAEEEHSIGKVPEDADSQPVDWDQLEREAFRHLPFYDPFALFAEGMGRGILARLKRERAQVEAGPIPLVPGEETIPETQNPQP